MSYPSVTQYFFTGQVKIMAQSFSPNSSRVVISMRPHLRFTSCYSKRRSPAKGGNSHDTIRRLVRDLNLAATVIWVNPFLGKVYCPLCRKTRIERQEFVEPPFKVDFSTWLANTYVIKSSDFSELKRRIK